MLAMRHPGERLRRPQHAARYRQIAGILTQHGLGFLVGVLGLERFEPFHRGILGHARRDAPYTQAEHLRMALEDLGATFIKLGQILSTRADLLPPEYQLELVKLQDAAPAEPSEAIRDIIESEFGRPVGELFATFDDDPVAAASIGQAHAATLPDGMDVIVKVRRPGVVERVEADLEILENLAAAASRRWEAVDDYDVLGIAQEFAQTLRAELDYIREGRNAERIAANFKDDDTVHIPTVLWELSSSRVLTLERLRGQKATELESAEKASPERRALAEHLADLFLKMVFDDGFFHADPHSGNFFVEPDGRIGLIDFGMVGSLDDRTQEQLTSVILAVTSQDAEQLVEAFFDLGVARRRIDRTLLRQDLEHLLSRYYGRPLGELPLGPVLSDMLAVVRRHHLQLPASLALLVKTVMMEEGLLGMVDPTFNLTTAITPFAERLMLRRFSPRLWLRRLGRASFDGARLATDLPQHLRRLVGDLERGGLEIGMRPVGFEPLLRRAERLANRLILGMITSALIVGVSVLMLLYRPVGWERLTDLLLGIGLVLTVGLGSYLAWMTVRARLR